METLTVRLPARHALELDRFRKRQACRPTKTACVLRAIEMLCDSDRSKQIQTEIPTPVSVAPNGEKLPLRIKLERDLPLEGVSA